MGRLFVVDDNITKEELLKQISRKFNLSVKNRRDRIFGYKNRSYMRAKSSCVLAKKSLKNINCFEVSELPSIKSSSKMNGLSSSSSQTYTSSPNLMTITTGLQCRDGKLRKAHHSHNEVTSSIRSSSPSQSCKTNRKRKNVTVVEDITECSLKQKLKPLCDVVDVICNHSGLSEEHLERSNNNNSCENEVPESMTPDSKWTQPERDSSFCLGRIFDGECSTATDLGQSKIESSQDIGCTSTSLLLPTLKVIPDWMYVALDCEMVGIGPKGKKSVLARCSIVGYDGAVLYDKYIRPFETITDYRTPWSGIRPVHMKSAVPIDEALRDIKECLAHKVIIGHAVYHDFQVIGLLPDNHFVRDTCQCKQLVEMAGLQGKGNGLKKLSEALLDRKIQVGNSGHCSIEDARATLDLFKLVRSSWEPDLYSRWSKKDANFANKMSNFVMTGTMLRENSTEDFLNDKFWPSHILD